MGALRGAVPCGRTLGRRGNGAHPGSDNTSSGGGQNTLLAYAMDDPLRHPAATHLRRRIGRQRALCGRPALSRSLSEPIGRPVRDRFIRRRGSRRVSRNFSAARIYLCGFQRNNSSRLCWSIGCLSAGLLYCKNGRVPVVSLLLAGFAISTMGVYSSDFLEILDRDFGAGTRILTSWLRGAITTPTWTQLLAIACLTALGMVASIPLCRLLNTIALGEEYAQHLGVNVELTRGGLIVVGSLLTAAAVALGGLISFVGLIVPHLARMIAGPDHSRLLPIVAVAGAVFLIATDTLARTLLTPAEIPVGVLMAFIGGPFFLFVLRRTGGANSL